MAVLEGVAVSGEYIESLKDKSFTIVKAPHYEERPSLDKPDEKVRKLVIFVRLSTGETMDYYPNKTSQKAMADVWGYEMDNWIGKSASWRITEQKVMGAIKKVLFVETVKEEKVKRKK